MKEIADKVGGLDVHRDTVVACTRVREPDGMVTLSKETFNTTRKRIRGLGPVPRRCWSVNRGDGGDRSVLEAGVLRIGGTLPPNSGSVTHNM
ncbi:hypothetical protein FEAC_05830 [Ferrimicrobium acidiphilum DSM 19497]|uniref:Uncharacterized protein n=1 Tax=Ferrimicrobium acidiphilum DSM 19497 TaxID=1121877 RepID=A0A0D8FWJ1_9ACTN|nr:hypothetical protein FEAC_05830 [Ferrimicrobium acidiphilum DSM 19497]